MQVITESNIRQVQITIHRYDTFFLRLKGLMFRFSPIKNEGILLYPCNSIHMFFMFFPIDVIFLNAKNEVILTKEAVKPWKVIFPVKQAIAVLELPVGSISQYEIQAGSVINV
ncbi:MULTISPECIES: DUF192 domain-containing protein [Bacillaceae]|uniref:DUF192 domain-containing protein n=1 Tax=Evansella alkalicola TaxID=745819 RepID=A0ABS6JST9_9BACI|nr:MULTISPECIES: DUF192 domain-containing protein [Bacillaceae]MBU9721312.1 DUF192 domain-containing protein [Bacillus alkalicola]